MAGFVDINHIALQFYDEEKAKIFFEKVLEIPLVREFKISKDLSNSIFKIKNDVNILVFQNMNIKFEVFITRKEQIKAYEHVCIEVNDLKDLLTRCIKYDIKPVIIKKDDKNLVFIKDYSDNLYEIKQL